MSNHMRILERTLAPLTVHSHKLTRVEIPVSPDLLFILLV